MLNAAGTVSKSSTRLADLKFNVEEQEAELESRDLNVFAKSAMPQTIKHHEYGCIGSESCAK
jgi:hypothetical protein